MSPVIIDIGSIDIGSDDIGGDWQPALLEEISDVASLVTQLNGDVVVVYFQDSSILEESRIQNIGSGMIAAADRAESRKLLLNFEEVRFMSSAMLGKIMQLNKKCKKEEISLKLCGIVPDIMEIFTMMKLHKILDIQKTEEKALASFAKKGRFF